MKTSNELQAILQDARSLRDRADSALSKKVEQETKGAAAVSRGNAGGYSHPIVGAESDEYKAMRAFGCSHVKQLIAVNTGHPKFKDVPEFYKHIVRQLKQDVDVSRYISQIFYDAPQDKIGKDEKQDYIAVVKNILDHPFGRNELAPRLKAFSSTGAGTGDEWVPTLLSSSFIEEFQLPHVLESRFQSMQMDSNPYKVPVQSGLKKARIIAENAQITDTTFITSDLTFTAIKLGEHHILPEEMTEDSAPNIMAAARDHVVVSQVRATESALLNGDNDGTHIDSDTQAGAADLAEKAWKGLRRQAIANSANGSTTDYANAAVSAANLRTQRSRMKKFGSDPSNLLIVAGPVVYQQLVGLPEVSTVDKFGPMATVLKGALAGYQGIPIVNSEHMREDLNASGVYDGSVVNRAGLVMVNLLRWYFGIRRPIRVKAMADLPYYDRFLLASYQRKDFQGLPQGASEVSVSYGVNIAV